MGRPKKKDEFKVKKGPLSTEEKGRIVDCAVKKIQVKDISKLINRSPDIISKYLDLVSNVLSPESSNTLSIEDMCKNVEKQLVNIGIESYSAKQKVAKVIDQLTLEDQKEITESTLFALASKMINARDLIINKSSGGNEGVTVMTQAASEQPVDKSQKPALKSIYKIF